MTMNVPLHDAASHRAAETYPLQSASWPHGNIIATDEPLCFRAEPRECWHYDADTGITALTPLSNVRQVVDFSTFFGALSLTTWCGTAGIDEVVIEARIVGECVMQVFEDNGYEGRQVLWKHRVSSDGATPVRVTLSSLKGRRGILFPAFEALPGDRFSLYSVDYHTTEPPRHAPSLAIVMPTFRRETYARTNAELIVREVLPAMRGRAKLYVIDNGDSLRLAPHEGLQLVVNRNFGGAGGFARGVLEAQAAAEGYSHVLFCDDDVRIDAQSIVRLMNLLGYVEQDRVVSGGMLKMGTCNVLHEKSANVTDMRFSSNHGNRDMRQHEAVARYDETSFSTFCGWWFVCYPLGSGRNSFLPFPFFVGWDDVEMGRRCNQLKIRVVSLLGVGIWHEEFEKKDVNWRWFYHTRNGLAVSLIYDRQQRAGRQALTEIMSALLTYRYERAEYMIDGMAAVARGPDCISARAADELHVALTARMKSKFSDVGYQVIPERLIHQRPPSRLRVFLARVTMNGHLLPDWMFRRAVDPADPGWVVRPLHSNQLNTIFRCRKVVYYEPISGRGIECEFDRARFFRLLFRMLKRYLLLTLVWRRAQRQWRDAHQQMTSPTFWRRFLGLEQ